jgi:hypothetical protein
VHRLAPALAEGLLQGLPSLARNREELAPRLASGAFAALFGLLHGLPTVRTVLTWPAAELLEATAEPLAVVLDELASAPPAIVPVAAPLVLRLVALETALSASRVGTSGPPATLVGELS